jgi:HD domain-containing protein
MASFLRSIIQGIPFFSSVSIILRDSKCLNSAWTKGAEILKDLDFLGTALSYIRYHHERPDGLGYPNRLKDADIPLGAKIIAVADTVRRHNDRQTLSESQDISGGAGNS